MHLKNSLLCVIYVDLEGATEEPIGDLQIALESMYKIFLHIPYHFILSQDIGSQKIPVVSHGVVWLSCEE